MTRHYLNDAPGSDGTRFIWQRPKNEPLIDVPGTCRECGEPTHRRVPQRFSTFAAPWRLCAGCTAQRFQEVRAHDG